MLVDLARKPLSIDYEQNLLTHAEQTMLNSKHIVPVCASLYLFLEGVKPDAVTHTTLPVHSGPCFGEEANPTL